MENEYLAHHGVKGMKWGVRRTPEQLGYRQAKKMARELNSLDQKRAMSIGYERKYRLQNQNLASKYNKAYYKARKTGSERQAAKVLKLAAKVNASAEKVSAEQAKRDQYQARAKEIGREAAKNNYNIRVSSVQRSTMTRGEAAAQAFLISSGYLVVNTGYNTAGTKFKAQKKRQDKLRYNQGYLKGDHIEMAW